MPYSDEDEARRTFDVDVDGYPADYYPSRRIRIVIGSILAGWFFVIFTSSHQAFVGGMYEHWALHARFMITRGSPLGDWPTTETVYAITGRATA